jgi:3-hydroxyisobutyrate dehydrogenase-like beta-hydroxyacid dehydrogenase
MDTVGFIGLGNMGGGMAGNIQKAGYPLVVYDTRPEAMRPFLEREARPAKSPAEVAQLSEIIFTSLPGPREVEAVAIGTQGVLEGIKAGGIYVDLSTSRPTLIRQIEPLFRQKGAHVLDAPVSGGKTGAATRNLAVMVGGERAIYERTKPILEAFGDKVFYAGSIGAGSICKLMHNMIGHGIRQAIAEGLTLGVRASGRGGPDERPARGPATDRVPRAIRTGQLCTGPIPQRHRPSDRAGPRVQRADARGQSRRANRDRGHEPRLGRSG